MFRRVTGENDVGCRLESIDFSFESCPSVLVKGDERLTIRKRARWWTGLPHRGDREGARVPQKEEHLPRQQTFARQVPARDLGTTSINTEERGGERGRERNSTREQEKPYFLDAGIRTSLANSFRFDRHPTRVRRPNVRILREQSPFLEIFSQLSRFFMRTLFLKF